MPQTSTQKPLYDRDLNLWLEETVAKLKARQFDELDLDNLIDEVEALARRDKRELRSRLKVLLSHLLKRNYVNSARDFRGWESTIREQRSALQDILDDSPSLKPYLVEVFDSVWQSALREAEEDYPSTQFPQNCPFPLDVDTLLTEKFWET
ncbi:MAG: DUF29 domain-containing protein [Oscillatoriales cyanobacterium C42_A2020_001]|nr:DUF29 domain-containing protein [Leptolyngbyaceae cyanobacterium C42_A2020_001]